MYELKPCPFCGGEAEVVTHPFVPQFDVFGVECTRCGSGTSQNYATKIGAIGAWNKRLNESAQKVIFESDGYADGNPVYDLAECPKCGFPFEDGDQDWESNYCPQCGQRLDWSDE